MELKDYYAILGVKPTDDLKTIKTAYRRLARKYHPDVSKESDAEAQFKDLAEAWEVLKDEQRRAEYDELWQHRNDPHFGQQQASTSRTTASRTSTTSSHRCLASRHTTPGASRPHAATI
ncbi:Curved DNA-binding protein [Raoultella terrigena]|uniref:Curved DNA-binding protein n=1 Tax=Raoultella terrigena TaxID=577 RepID=A0A4U9DAS1_RAOTE|nr:Curved DNA-binding protein [Raoultella terrigena]